MNPKTAEVVSQMDDLLASGDHIKWDSIQEWRDTLKAIAAVGDSSLTVCPDGCYRPKARNADDCAAGCCSKWYAVRDSAASDECGKLSRFWKQASQPSAAVVDEAMVEKCCYAYDQETSASADSANPRAMHAALTAALSAGGG